MLRSHFRSLRNSVKSTSSRRLSSSNPVLLKSCYMSKVSYLSRVTPHQIFESFAKSIMDWARGCSLSNGQWGQCLLKPRNGGLSLMNLEDTSKGAYLPSLLACLPSIDSVSVQQQLSLQVLQFDHHGLPRELNVLSSTTSKLYEHVANLHTKAVKYNWLLALLILNRIPSADQKSPWYITPDERQNKIHAINARAAVPWIRRGPT